MNANSTYFAHERFEKFRIQDGLSSSKVFDIKQDEDGYIWCATDEGFCRFDGVDFKSYGWSLGGSLDFMNQQTLKLFCDKNYIYIATNFGLLMYDVETDTYKLLENNTLQPGEKSQSVRSIIKRKAGGLWIGTYGGGVYSVDTATGSFERFQYQASDDRILSLYESDEGLLYIGTHFGGLDIVDLKTRSVTNYSIQSHNLLDSQVESIFQDSYGNIWVGTWQGLVRFVKGKKEPEPIELGELKGAQVNCIEENRLGQLWVGTEYFLCSITLKPGDEEIKSEDLKFYYESETETGLSYKTIRCLLSDKNDNLWIGTYGGGVNFVNQHKQKFNYITSDALLTNSLSYKHVSSFSEDKHGNLWITTDGGGLNYWDIANNTFEEITAKTKGYNLSDDATLCSLVDSDNDLWIGTYKCVLNRMKDGTKRFIHYVHQEGNPNSLMYSDLSCLYEDSKKNIWIGQRGGLSYFDKKSDSFYVIEPLKWHHITALGEYKEHLIVGTFDGLYKYYYNTGRIELLSTKLKNVLVNSFAFDPRGKLWIGTEGQGLWEYTFDTDSLGIYRQADGLNSSIVRELILVGDDLWMGTNKDIVKMSTKTKEFDFYSASDGVQPGSFLKNSGLMMKSGMIALGGTEGMNIFDPTIIAKDTTPASVVFTDFLLFNQPVGIRSEQNPASPLIKDINSTDRIELNYDESVFTIEYLGINYSSPERIRYAYFLKGVDTEWNKVGSMRSVTYRNLKPGSYCFMVMASSPSGNFDEDNVRILYILIKPPFWQTWWAYVVYFIMLLGLLYLGWNITMMKIRVRERINYERLEKQKQKELYQAKLQFFTNASHELKNPLTLILAPLEKLLLGETDSKKRYLLSLIKRNTMRVIKNVNEVIDIRKIDYGQLKLQVKEVDVVSLFKEIADTFEGVVEDKNINFVFNTSADRLLGWVSPKFMDKIVYNILSNAFKYVKDYDEIVMNVFVEQTDIGNLLHIEVSDTGIGINKKDLKKIFDCFYQVELNDKNIVYPGSGIGLYLVKSLVELHKGHISVESELNVGSRFAIVIPFDKASYSREEIAGAEKKEDSHATFVKETMQEDIEIVEDNTDGKNEIAKKYKILVVDDESEIRDFLAMELCEEYEVYTAADGVEGLESALNSIPDLIISDVIMPNMDGIELCEKIKSDINTSHIPIILLTAKETHEDRLRGLEVGANSYIPKPFDIRHLRIRVEQLIKYQEAVKEKFMKKVSLVSGEESDTETVPTMSHDDILIQKIINYINENISDPDIKGESIASHVGMSRMNLHRKLKALVGLSSGDFIRTVRLENAKKELLNTNKTITEISYDLGFSSPSYFYICFVKKFGMSPTEFRGQHESPVQE
ncbi:hybrid sensor histidine kinase/response regulator transcription factor [Bacteroides sp.]